MQLAVNSRRTYLWIASLMILFGCVEPYQPEVSQQTNDVLVVDGFFVPNDSTRIILSSSGPIDYVGSNLKQNSAQLQIEDDHGTVYALASIGDGVYVLPPTEVDINSTYRLNIRTADGLEYSSEF